MIDHDDILVIHPVSREANVGNVGGHGNMELGRAHGGGGGGCGGGEGFGGGGGLYGGDGLRGGGVTCGGGGAASAWRELSTSGSCRLHVRRAVLEDRRFLCRITLLISLLFGRLTQHDGHDA